MLEPEAHLPYPDRREPLELLCPLIALPFLEHHTNGIMQSVSGFFYLTQEVGDLPLLLYQQFPLLLTTVLHTGYTTLCLIHHRRHLLFLTIMNKACIEICGLILYGDMLLFCQNKFEDVELLAYIIHIKKCQTVVHSSHHHTAFSSGLFGGKLETVSQEQETCHTHYSTCNEMIAF